MNTKKPSIELVLAWRNVWKNKRRTVLTLLTIMVGTAMIIFMRALQDGGYAQMIDDAVSANTGHIQIHEKGFYENQSIDYAFIPGAALLERLKTGPGISGFTRRIHASGLISSASTTEGAMIQGVDPAAEKNVSNIHRSLRKGGRYLSAGDGDSVVIGDIMARNLGVKEGDEVSIISQGFDGTFAAANLTVVGIFRSGNVEYDRFLVLMPIAKAVATFSVDNYVNSIVLRLADGRMTERIRDELRASFGTKSLEIMGYDELIPDLMQYIMIDRISGEILYWILFLVVAFGVLNTIQMSVYERIREFGIMLAVGTEPGQVRWMVQIESAIISVYGILMGIALGVALSAYFAVYPMDFSGYAQEFAEWGMATTILPAKLEAWNPLTTAIVTFILSSAFTMFPARRASRLRPVEAIRKL